MKEAPSVCSRPPFCVVYRTNSSVERMAVSAVQTPEQRVEKYISKIIADQAEVDECTRLVAAECTLKYPITMSSCHYQRLTEALVVLEHLNDGVQNIQHGLAGFNKSKLAC
jgi:hypothetical protein